MINSSGMRTATGFIFILLSVLISNACGKAEGHLESIDDSNKKLVKRLEEMTGEVGRLSQNIEILQENTSLALGKILGSEDIESLPQGLLEYHRFPSLPDDWIRSLREGSRFGHQMIRTHQVFNKDAVAIFQYINASAEEAIAVWTDFERAASYLGSIENSEIIWQRDHELRVAYTFSYGVASDSYVTHYRLKKDHPLKAFQISYEVHDSAFIEESFGRIWFLPDPAAPDEGCILVSSGHAKVSAWLESLMNNLIQRQTRSMVEEIERVKEKEPQLLRNSLKFFRQRLN